MQTFPAASSILLFTEDFSLRKISRRFDSQAGSKASSPVSERIIHSRAKDCCRVRHFSMHCPLCQRGLMRRVPMGRTICRSCSRRPRHSGPDFTRPNLPSTLQEGLMHHSRSLTTKSSFTLLIDPQGSPEINVSKRWPEHVGEVEL